MRLRTSAALSAILIVATPMIVQADNDYTVPPVCQSSKASAVELVDCLQTQQEILQHIIDYESLMLKVDDVHRQRTEPVPPHPDQQTEPSAANDTRDPTMERVNWFDQNLEIYAIVGNDESRIAHARLEGREYRLRIDDQVRLATVIQIDPRAVHLAIPGVEFSVGLSGSASSAPQHGNTQ